MLALQASHLTKFHVLAGTYSSYGNSPASDRTACTDADVGHYSEGTITVNGVLQIATSQNACDVGSYQANTGQSSCTETDAGYYQDQTAQSSQKACAAGNYQSATGATSCTNTDPGYYSPGTVAGINVASEQIPCPAGTYQALSTQSSCDDADAGNYSLGTYSEWYALHCYSPNQL